jgi:hypothetical protein
MTPWKLRSALPEPPRRALSPADQRLKLLAFLAAQPHNVLTAQEAFAKDWIAAYHKHYEAH